MGRQKTPAIQRFNSRISIDPATQCWIWTGQLDKNGYGIFWDDCGVRAHRWSYEFHKGIIPDGLTIDHLCRVKPCVNPDHIEPVTNKENILRAKALITVCRQGHEYTPENTYYNKNVGWKGCKICRHNRSIAWQNENRELINQRYRDSRALKIIEGKES